MVFDVLEVGVVQERDELAGKVCVRYDKSDRQDSRAKVIDLADTTFVDAGCSHCGVRLSIM